MRSRRTAASPSRRIPCSGSIYIALLLLLAAPCGHARINDFGITGVLDVPSARMRDDGDLGITYSRKKIADIYTISYQATPWLETAFRYTIFNPRSVEGSRDQLKDRSFEVKARLWQEGEWLPEVAVGIRDLVGTGAWDGEYVVATKEMGPLEVTLGLGWGRFADRDIGRNPLRFLSSSFERRTAATGQGGDFGLGDYYSGPNVGLFGGFRYTLPRWNVALEGAYNSDSYARERRFGTVDDTSPWSFGVVWEPVQDIELGVSWQQGNQLALRFTSTVNTAQTTARKAPNRYGAPGTEPAPARRPRRNQTWYDSVAREAHTSGLLLRSAQVLDEKTVNVTYTNQAYQYEADASRRLLALVNLYAPKQYQTVIATAENHDVATHSVHYTRPGRTTWAAEIDASQEHREAVVMPPLRAEAPDFVTPFRYPSGAWNVGLGVRPFLFDPDDPLRIQIFARIGGQVDFGGGWGFSATWIQSLYSEFDGITRQSDSVLPRVRSDVIRYLQEGESGIDNVVLSKRGQFSDELYYLGFAGILEEMYSGFGGEVLYRPFGSRFAYGANIIGVQQRDFDKRFGHQDYRTWIGHLSVYWASPLYNFDVAVHAGRYLAKDVGATLEVQKRFANGWSVGAFATLTDVPFDDFGEGSFDKGLIFRVPFNAYFGFNTRGAYSAIMRPIQRDGGQRLNWGTTLWETHRATHFDHLNADPARMVPQ